MSVASALPHVLHTILFVTVHEMYDLRRLRTCAEMKFCSKYACATGRFIFPLDSRMGNRNLYFPVGCAHAQHYVPCPVLGLVTLRRIYMGRKSYIPCASHENILTELCIQTIDFIDFYSKITR